MRKSKFLLAVFMGLVALAIVSSCNKDEGKNESVNLNNKLLKELNKVGVKESIEVFSELRTTCFIPQSPCASTITRTLNFQYTHPNYPGCVVTIPTKVVTCFNSSGVPLNINFDLLGDFQTWSYTSQCYSLKSHWIYLYQTNQIGVLEAELVNLYKGISNYIENTYMQALLLVYQLKCPFKFVETNVAKRSCTTYCFSYNGEFFEIYAPQCGTACCVRKKVMCLNPNNTINVMSTNFYQQGTCNDGLPNCNPGDGGGKVCRSPCEFL